MNNPHETYMPCLVYNVCDIKNGQEQGGSDCGLECINDVLPNASRENIVRRQGGILEHQAKGGPGK